LTNPWRFRFFNRKQSLAVSNYTAWVSLEQPVSLVWHPAKPFVFEFLSTKGTILLGRAVIFHLVSPSSAALRFWVDLAYEPLRAAPDTVCLAPQWKIPF
jgi:hypothetical protein